MVADSHNQFTMCPLKPLQKPCAGIQAPVFIFVGVVTFQAASSSSLCAKSTTTYGSGAFTRTALRMKVSSKHGLPMVQKPRSLHVHSCGQKESVVTNGRAFHISGLAEEVNWCLLASMLMSTGAFMLK